MAWKLNTGGWVNLDRYKYPPSETNRYEVTADRS